LFFFKKIFFYIFIYRPRFIYRVPILIFFTTFPTILITTLAWRYLGMKTGISIGFFFSIPIIILACYKIFMQDWLDDEK